MGWLKWNLYCYSVGFQPCVGLYAVVTTLNSVYNHFVRITQQTNRKTSQRTCRARLEHQKGGRIRGACRGSINFKLHSDYEDGQSCHQITAVDGLHSGGPGQ
jgi:hypothetical protein